MPSVKRSVSDDTRELGKTIRAFWKSTHPDTWETQKGYQKDLNALSRLSIDAKCYWAEKDHGGKKPASLVHEAVGKSNKPKMPKEFVGRTFDIDVFVTTPLCKGTWVNIDRINTPTKKDATKTKTKLSYCLWSAFYRAFGFEITENGKLVLSNGKQLVLGESEWLSLTEKLVASIEHRLDCDKMAKILGYDSYTYDENAQHSDGIVDAIIDMYDSEEKGESKAAVKAMWCIIDALPHTKGSGKPKDIKVPVSV